MALRFSEGKGGSYAKVCNDDECGYNLKLGMKKGPGKYTALLDPPIKSEIPRVHVLALDVTIEKPGTGLSFGLAPPSTDLEQSLTKQPGICGATEMEGGSILTGSDRTGLFVDGKLLGDLGDLMCSPGTMRGVLLVWRPTSDGGGEFGLFAPLVNLWTGWSLTTPQEAKTASVEYMTRMPDVGGSSPCFFPAPSGCTHFAVTGSSGATFKINHTLAEEATAALKGGDLAAFGEWLKAKRSADLAATGCCIIA